MIAVQEDRDSRLEQHIAIRGSQVASINSELNLANQQLAKLESRAQGDQIERERVKSLESTIVAMNNGSCEYDAQLRAEYDEAKREILTEKTAAKKYQSAAAIASSSGAFAGK